MWTLGVGGGRRQGRGAPPPGTLLEKDSTAVMGADILGAGGSVGVTYNTGLEEAPGPLELFLQLDPQHSNDTSPLHSLLT